MNFLKLPVFDELENRDNILIAGAGGGFDVFCGLPLYFALRNAGKRVHLANLSFSNISGSTGRKLLGDDLVEITSSTQGNESYFPELHLARWFEGHGFSVPVYCFANTGVRPLLNAYKKLVEDLHIQAVILVDGGTDSLMRGDEFELGSPQEDIASISAVAQLDVRSKMLICLGFGIDNICHAQFLEAVAEITSNAGFLGTWSLTEDMIEVKLYRAATETVFRVMPEHPSVISASVLSALAGRYGNYHLTDRTLGRELYINPLMTLYWCFRLEAVANRMLYPDAIRNTEKRQELTEIISHYRDSHHKSIKGWETLPM